MEQINQLRDMRDQAWAELKATADYKLANSLDSLISDLENALGLDTPSREHDATDEKDEAAGAGSKMFFAPAEDDTGDESESDEEDLKPFEAETLPPMNIAADSENDPETSEDQENEPEEQNGESLLAAVSDDDEPKSDDSDDDVMSELTQMIHAGFGDQPAEDTREPSRSEPADDVDDGDSELAEQDAIIQAMKALDEDLSRSGIGVADDDDSDDDETEKK